MFGLEELTGLVYFVFIVIIILFVLGWITIGIVILVYKKKKTKHQPRILLRKILDENDYNDINIGERRGLIKAQNFGHISNSIIIRRRDNKDQSIVKVYDILFHFYFIYQQKAKSSRPFYWLKFLSWFILFSITLFIISTILVIVSQFIKKDVYTIIGIVIQVFSGMGVGMLVISWFCWTNVVENYRKELISLATEFLTDQEVKEIKIFSAFKAFLPLSENVIFYT